MTDPTRTLSLRDAADQIARALQPSEPGRESVGLEVEWIVVDASDPTRIVPGDEVLAAASGHLPAGGSLSVEPGGQLELSTVRHDDAWLALEAAAADEVVLNQRMTQSGLRLLATGIDPFRTPHRSLDQPRYRAMEAAFDARGPEGRMMMCSTAALQVNVDFGLDPLATWERADLVAPILAATFANSPQPPYDRAAGGSSDGSTDGAPITSRRAAIWAAIDPSRTRPVPVGSEQWVTYALDADVLFVRHGPGVHSVGEAFTLRRWIEEGHPLGYPDLNDIAEHLTTLFPPLRPRGWLECRFLDAQAPGDRMVAVLVLTALVSDQVPMEAVRTACATDGDAWPLVPTGLADPAMRTASVRCLNLAADILDARWPGSAVGVRAWIEERSHAAQGPVAPDLQSVVTLEQEIH